MRSLQLPRNCTEKSPNKYKKSGDCESPFFYALLGHINACKGFRNVVLSKVFGQNVTELQPKTIGTKKSEFICKIMWILFEKNVKKGCFFLLIMI